jgi:hypothetical protein
MGKGVKWLSPPEGPGVSQQEKGDFSRVPVDNQEWNLAGHPARFSQPVLVYIMDLLCTKMDFKHINCPDG